jgi:hypothetical protein
MSGDRYEQTGDSGIGHMSGGTIQSGAKVAGFMINFDQKNLDQRRLQVLSGYTKLIAHWASLKPLKNIVFRGIGRAINFVRGT